jgi:VWFA-related protein
MIFGRKVAKGIPLARAFCAAGVALHALLLAATTVGQVASPNPPATSAPAPAPAASVPSIRISTRLVQISVVVKDKKGNPVTDLTKDDFTLLDENKPQAISVFSEQTTQPAPAMAQPLPANTFTNRFEDRTGVPTSVTVVLFDALNTHFDDIAYARLQVLKLIDQFQPDGRVAIFGLTQDLVVIQNFTDDRQTLLGAVKNYTPRDSMELGTNASVAGLFDASNNGPAQINIGETSPAAAEYYRRDRALRTATALQAIAHYVGRLPGRKNLVWVSSSFPFSADAEQVLSDADIAVYPVDAMGLRAGGPAPSPAMDFIAKQTGGRAFYNGNDVSGSIREALQDSQVTYVLGYYPDHGAWNDEFRQLDVKVDRPGLEVRYRNGYYAAQDAPPTPVTRQALLQEAVDSPLDSTSIGITVKATLTGSRSMQTVRVAVRVDSHAIALSPDGDQSIAALDWLVAQWDAKGKLLKAQAETTRIRVDQSNRDAWENSGLGTQFALPLLPGAARIRIAACDDESGATGSVTIPIKRLVADTH